MDSFTVDKDLLGLGEPPVQMPKPGDGDYFAKPPTKRRDKYGNYDITTPPGMLDKDENYVSILTTGENRHPDEDKIIEHYARQLVAKREGTYNPLEDAPVILRDLLPNIFVVVNKTFTKDEITVGGGQEMIVNYVKALSKHIDFDIIPVMCGKPLVLPLHPNIAVQHRDPIFNAQMQSFYKQHDKGAKDIMERIVRARKENELKMEEQKKREKHALKEQKEGLIEPAVEEDKEIPRPQKKQRIKKIEDLDKSDDDDDEKGDGGGKWETVGAKKAQRRAGMRKAPPGGTHNGLK